MAESKSVRKLAGKAKKSEAGKRGLEGQAAVAEKNRQRKIRLRIIETFIRLGIPYVQWPDFARAYYAEPSQRIEFHYAVFPSAFQAPAFDRSNQLPEDWVKMADGAWELHRKRSLECCELQRYGDHIPRYTRKEARTPRSLPINRATAWAFI